MCEALVVGSGWRPEQVRRRLVCVTRQMDVFARSAMARHFGVHNDDVTDVVVVGDLHAQRRLIVVNTEQVRAEARPRVLECGGSYGHWRNYHFWAPGKHSPRALVLVLIHDSGHFGSPLPFWAPGRGR